MRSHRRLVAPCKATSSWDRTAGFPTAWCSRSWGSACATLSGGWRPPRASPPPAAPQQRRRRHANAPTPCTGGIDPPLGAAGAREPLDTPRGWARPLRAAASPEGAAGLAPHPRTAVQRPRGPPTAGAAVAPAAPLGLPAASRGASGRVSRAPETGRRRLARFGLGGAPRQRAVRLCRGPPWPQPPTGSSPGAR